MSKKDLSRLPVTSNILQVYLLGTSEKKSYMHFNWS